MQHVFRYGWGERRACNVVCLRSGLTEKHPRPSIKPTCLQVEIDPRMRPQICPLCQHLVTSHYTTISICYISMLNFSVLYSPKNVRSSNQLLVRLLRLQGEAPEARR